MAGYYFPDINAEDKFFSGADVEKSVERDKENSSGKTREKYRENQTRIAQVKTEKSLERNKRE